MMIDLKKILLVEDNQNDLELTIEALSEHNLANRVVALSDGVEALDYLFYRGAYAISRSLVNLIALLIRL